MSETSLTGDALEAALGTGALDAGGSEALDVIVRPSERAGNVGVSVSGCGAFVDVPTELIEKAEPNDLMSCAGKRLPRMWLTLKSSDDPVAQVLVKLLQRPEGRPGGRVEPGASVMGAQARFNSPMVWYGGCVWVCICVRWSTLFPGMCNECLWTPMVCPGGGLFAQ